MNMSHYSKADNIQPSPMQRELVTLEILTAELSIDGALIHRPRDRQTQGAFAGIRLWTNAPADVDEQYIYLVQASTLDKDEFGSSRVCHVFYGAEDPKLENAAYLFVPNRAIGLIELFSLCQAVFEKYSRWSSDLLAAIAEDRGLSTLLTLSYPFFNNPMYIADSAFSVLGHTDPELSIKSTPEWDSIITNGVISSQIIAQVESENIERLDRQAHPVFVQTIDTDGGRNIVAHFEENGKRVAHLSIIGCDSPLKKHHLDLADYLMQCIELVLDMHSSDIRKEQSDARWLRTLLTGASIDAEWAQSHIKALGWSGKDVYRISVIHFAKNRKNGADSLAYYYNDIMSLLPRTFCFLFEESLVVFDHASAEREIAKLSQEEATRFIAYLQANQLCCTSSSTFANVLEAPAFYEQARELQNLASRERPIVVYPESMLDHIAHSYLESRDLNSALHPLVRAIASRGGGAARELVDTLYHYILLGRSHKRCAEQLNVHRNTIAYRMDRIREFADIDFEDSDLLGALVLSCALYRQLTESEH